MRARNGPLWGGRSGSDGEFVPSDRNAATSPPDRRTAPPAFRASRRPSSGAMRGSLPHVYARGQV